MRRPIPVVARVPREPVPNYKRQAALGQHPTWEPGMEEDAAFEQMVKIPAFYPIIIELGGEDGDNQPGSVPLRPEPFVCRRITWATTGDTPTYSTGIQSGSIQGRAVEISFGDEFVDFLGDRSTLIAALFGDSQGYLDIPRGILFQGRQTLRCRLNRLFWPDTQIEPATTRWDIVFHGIALLPAGVQQSGSAR